MRAVLALALLSSLACESARRPGGVSPTNNQPRADATSGDGSGEGGDSSASGEDARPQEDAGNASSPDAFTGSPDAFTGSPDAFTGSPDAFTGSPDAFTGPPDAQPSPFDAGVRDGGLARDASVSMDPCGELAPCCTGLVLVLLPDCATTASSGDRSACQSSLDSLAAVGVCGPAPDAGPRIDAGPRPDAAPAADASAPAGTCADLAACCATLADPSQCLLLAGSGLDLLCDAFLGTLGGVCPP